MSSEDIIKVLLLNGGASCEHDISVISGRFLANHLQSLEGIRFQQITFPKSGELPNLHYNKHDYVIPYFHGYPGESGDIQSLLKFHQVSYLGAHSEGHKNCFNKVTTKLYCNQLEIPNTPFIFLTQYNENSLKKAHEFFENASLGVFVKSSRQGSSVGCFLVKNKNDLSQAIQKAFEHDDLVLIEQLLKTPRELELSAFEYKEELHITNPGEILPPEDTFYSFEEKYSGKSQSQATVEANLDEQTKQLIKEYARKLFINLQLKDLARIDFFLTDERKIYLNEINTFPGLTPISMFPKMMEHYGVKFQDFLRDRILSR